MLTLSLICGTSKSNAVKSLSNWFFIKMISSLTSTNSTSSISSSSSSLTNYQMFSRILKLRIYEKNFFCFVFLQVEFFDWGQKNCEFSQKTHTLCSPFKKSWFFLYIRWLRIHENMWCAQTLFIHIYFYGMTTLNGFNLFHCWLVNMATSSKIMLGLKNAFG